MRLLPFLLDVMDRNTTMYWIYEDAGCTMRFMNKHPNSSKYLMACKEQENMLNMYYTIGTSILSGSGMKLNYN